MEDLSDERIEVCITVNTRLLGLWKRLVETCQSHYHPTEPTCHRCEEYLADVEESRRDLERAEALKRVRTSVRR